MHVADMDQVVLVFRCDANCVFPFMDELGGQGRLAVQSATFDGNISDRRRLYCFFSTTLINRRKRRALQKRVTWHGIASRHWIIRHCILILLGMTDACVCKENGATSSQIHSSRDHVVVIVRNIPSGTPMRVTVTLEKYMPPGTHSPLTAGSWHSRVVQA